MSYTQAAHAHQPAECTQTTQRALTCWMYSDVSMRSSAGRDSDRRVTRVTISMPPAPHQVVTCDDGWMDGWPYEVVLPVAHAAGLVP